MTNGTVFNIQKFSVNDGPGIRTTVFLKGCPLRCVWCHNPESKLAKPEIMYSPTKCIGCRACEAVCPKKCHIFSEDKHIFDREKCIGCGECVKVCYTDALSLAGEIKTVDEVIAEVMKDKVFYDNSGGGMTLSGGEPMMQFEFTLALLKAAKEKGLHTCMETCGFAKAEAFKEVAPYVDIFLFDYKITDSDTHKKYTGVDNELILNNLHILDEMGCNTVLRCPIIPDINDNDEHLCAIAELGNSLKNVLEINIEPYHPLGKDKATMLGREYPLAHLTFPSEESVKYWIDTVAAKTALTVRKA